MRVFYNFHTVLGLELTNILRYREGKDKSQIHYWKINFYRNFDVMSALDL